MSEPALESAVYRWLCGHWPALAAAGPVRRLQRGWTNETYAVGRPARFALQRLSADFGLKTVETAGRIAAALSGGPIALPAPLPGADGALAARDRDGRWWRLSRWLAGDVHDAVTRPALAHGAARALAMLHAALARDASALALVETGFHDTDARIAALARSRRAAGDAGDRETVALADEIAAAWADWQDWSGGRRGTPRPGHGDPKINNFVFAAGGDRVTGLVDLDTFGLFGIDEELGDALRSWCNTAPADRPAGRIDREIFQAAIAGYRETAPAAPDGALIVAGFARMAIELAARYAADLPHSGYWAWDPNLAPDARAHNLLRARRQLDLARRIADERGPLTALAEA